jgi:hypothetical protein
MTTYIKTPHSGIDLSSSFDNNLSKLLDLKVEGDIAYVMKRSDGLWAIKSDPRGTSKWYKLSGPNAGETMDPGKAKFRASVEPELVGEKQEEKPNYQLGWYQSPKADLYKYDGEQWTDGKKTVLVSNPLFNTLEFLG